MKRRKKPEEKSRKKTKKTKLNTRSGYNVMCEHNYFHNFEKKKCRWPDENEKSNHTEMEMINDYDNYDSVPDWCIVRNSSDEDDNTEDMPLSYILKKELKKDLLHEYENKKCTNDLLPFNEDQMYNELNNTNNHDLLNISIGSSNIIGENNLINDGKQSKIMQIVPLANDATIIQNQNITNGIEVQTCNQPHNMKIIVKNNFKHNNLLSNAPINIKARKNLFDNNLQNYLLSSSSLHLSNSLLVSKACPSYNNAAFTTTDTSTNNVCPPLHWIHLIYLAIKNSAKENVTCNDIQRSVRCWFPYYCARSYAKFIHIILSHINHNCQKYFHCNSFTTAIHQDDSWTVNSIHINTLEESLMKIVENNENEIKLAMTHPDQLSTILNGYGVLYLGCSQDSIQN